MEIMEAILTRRSVRRFTSQSVAPETLQALLKAAMYAPSACNQQPWHFIVLQEREKLNAVAAVHPYAKMLNHAPLAIIVCGDLTLETCPGNWAIDCSAAMENLLLAAHGMGLGGVWVGIHPVDVRVQDFRTLLNLPGHVTPLCLAALGYASDPLPKAERFNAARIHHEAW